MTAKCLNIPEGKECHLKRHHASIAFLQNAFFISIFCCEVQYLEVLRLLISCLFFQV